MAGSHFLPWTMMMCHPHCVLTGSRSQSPSLHVRAASQKSGSSSSRRFHPNSPERPALSIELFLAASLNVVDPFSICSMTESATDCFSTRIWRNSMLCTPFVEGGSALGSPFLLLSCTKKAFLAS
uniref:Uncharacterized protein n=1 Tax=Chrysotila carterae TaxID=13221 RepID=A0A7S4B3K7_CHRCT